VNFYQDVFFRGLDFLRGRRTIERLHFLRRSQYWDRDTLADWQLRRLNELLLHARDNSPYYGKQLRTVELPLKTLRDVSCIPILSKADIQGNFETLQCGNIPRSRFELSRTGGSTGEPTYYYWDRQGMDWNRASVYRSAEWAGVALGERTIQMSGSHFDYSQAQKTFNRIVYLLQRYRDYPVAFLTEELMDQYLEGIAKWQPTSIWGYASGIHSFARHIQKHHPGSSFPYLKALITSSETLQPQQRETINAVFGAGKVHDNYGSREMYMGAECREHAGYHLHSEVLLIEVVDKDNQPCPPGVTGRILITDLANHAFPFIRYEIGDVGAMHEDSPCSCGVTLPRLAKVEGRIADLIVLPDRILTPPNITVLMSDMRGVKSYQLRQDKLDELRLLVVPDDTYNESVGQYVVGALRQLAGTNVSVNLELVPEIPVSQSGKRRYVISSISSSQL
jgi:phenylacetate-CoA ligase